jgi:hypothetical protein
MARGASTAAPAWEVQRGFEPKRFAEECQARAYEEILPVLPSRRGRAARVEAVVAEAKQAALSQEGVAA